MRFTINYITAAATVTSVAAGPTMVTTSITQRTGRTNPLLLTSSKANNPMNGTFVNGGGVFSVSCGVVSTTTPNSFASALLPSCRLYVSAYIMNPTHESQLVSIRSKREVVFDTAPGT